MRDILYQQQQSSRLHTKVGFSHPQKEFSEMGRADCVPCRCLLQMLYRFTCFTCTICFTVASRKRGRQAQLWYQPSKALQRIRLLHIATPAEYPGCSALCKLQKNIGYNKPANIGNMTTAKFVVTQLWTCRKKDFFFCGAFFYARKLLRSFDCQ